jgi:hypothetical protein
MGIKDWLSGRRGVDREIQEMMNPLIAWRLQLALWRRRSRPRLRC